MCRHHIWVHLLLLNSRRPAQAGHPGGALHSTGKTFLRGIPWFTGPPHPYVPATQAPGFEASLMVLKLLLGSVSCASKGAFVCTRPCQLPQQRVERQGSDHTHLLVEARGSVCLQVFCSRQRSRTARHTGKSAQAACSAKQQAEHLVSLGIPCVPRKSTEKPLLCLSPAPHAPAPFQQMLDTSKRFSHS